MSDSSDDPAILSIPGLHWFFDNKDVWVCGAPDHGPFCRLCQKVDGVLEALLENVVDGRMEWSIDSNGEFRFKMTELGNSVAAALIRRASQVEPGDVGGSHSPQRSHGEGNRGDTEAREGA